MSIVTRPEWAPVASVMLQLEPVAARPPAADDQGRSGGDKPPQTPRRTKAEAGPASIKAFAAGQPISIYNAFGRLVEVDERPTLDGLH